MAAFDTFRPAAAPFGGRFSFAAMVAAFQSWNDARLTRKALSQLSARELSDIGLSRGEIEQVVARKF